MNDEFFSGLSCLCRKFTYLCDLTQSHDTHSPIGSFKKLGLSASNRFHSDIVIRQDVSNHSMLIAHFYDLYALVIMTTK